MLRKHFLQLGGLGVRDLHFAGDDLFILAGPTMVLDGDIRLFRWPRARAALADNREPVRFQQAFAAPSSCRTRRATTAPRPFASCPQDWCAARRRWLVLYDAPGEGRREGDTSVFGDLLRRD